MIYQHNHQTVNGKACRQHARIFMDSFSDEYFMSKMFPTVYGCPSTPAVAAIRKKVGDAWARAQYLKLQSGKYVLFNLDGVATALYALPPAAAAQLTFVQRVRHWLYRWWYYFVDAYNGFPLNWYLESPQSKNWWAQWNFDPEDDYERLASLTFDELSKERYPQRELVWLAILAVRQNTQAKGYGSQLLEESLDLLGGGTTEFKSGSLRSIGPAKVGLFPTRGNHSFYERHGFHTVLSKELNFHGETYTHRMMQRVI